MKNLFVFCENSFEFLLKYLPESDGVVYHFFSEIKLLDIAIKQKKPNALLFKGIEFNDAILNCISDNDINDQTPIVILGKFASISSLHNFKIHTLPDKVNKAILKKVFSELNLVSKKSTLSNNVTDKTKSNDSIDNQQFLNLLMDNSPDAIYFKDRKSRYTKINYAEATLLQVADLEKVIGKSHEDFFTQNFSKKTFLEEQAVMESGIPLVNKLAHINTLAGKKHVRATKAPLMNNNGVCIGLIGITRDVTKEYLIDKELRTEKKLMDLLMNNVPDRIYFKDKNSRFIRCNMAMAKISGVSLPEELYGKTDFDFHDSVYAKKAFEEEQEIMNNLLPIFDKEESFLREGERFWELTTKIPLIDGQNKVIGLVGISHNFTKQKKLENKLEREKELLQILMDNVPDYIYFKDKKSKYIRVNKAISNLFKVGAVDDIIGKTDSDFFSEEVANDFYSQDLEVLKDRKKIINKVVKLKTFNKNTLWISSTKVPIKDENSKIIGLVGISRDATMQEKTKQRFLTAKVKAEEANKAKGLFLATMSHEIRTPMNGIIGMADILSKSKLGPLQMEYLDIIMKSGETLLSIINDVLDFSKIESGKMELETAPLNIRNIIEEVADIQIVLAKEKSIDILTFIDPKIPEFVIGDDVRLKQVITNLVNNAIKFTPTGEVLIHADYIEESNGFHEIQFKVKDSGIGITKENQKKLFKSFSQVDPSSTSKYGGTGLGLVISKRLVSLMKGKLKIDSAIGSGSTFFFKVKFAISNEYKKKSKLFCIKQLRKKHIVIVDDNETTRLIFKNYLETWHVKVTEFKDGLEALSFLKTKHIEGKPIDLIMIDYQMSNMAGEELAKLIKNEKQLSALKLVLLSSITDAIPLWKINKAGFETGLNKPVKMNQLLNVILKVLGIQQEQEVYKNTDNKDRYKSYKNKKFLIVEDNLVNIKVAQIVLSQLSQHVQVAKNGLEAIDLFKTNDFDIILMDIRMPKMDGIEATLKIRELEQNTKTEESVKIIAMTANTFQEDIEDCMDNGMDAFLEKPFKRKDLVNILRRLL